MSVIVDLDDFVLYLKMRLRLYKEKYKKVNVDIDQESARRLCHAFISDFVDAHLLWCRRRPCEARHVVEELFPWWRATGEKEAHVDFEEEVLVEVSSYIEDMLSPYVPDNTWDVITVMRRGARCLVSRGEDYRILDWYRIQEEKRRGMSDGTNFAGQVAT